MSSTSSHKSIYSNASFLVFAQVLVRILRSLYIVLLIRYLGPELYGVFQYAQNWYVAFTPLTLFGLGAILSREISINRSNADTIIGTALIIRVLSGVFFSLIILSLGLIIEPEVEIRNLLVVFSLLLLGRSLVNLIKETFIALEITQYHLVQVVTSNIVQIILGVIVMLMGGDLVSLALTYVLCLLLEFFVAIIFIHKKVMPINLDVHISKVVSIFQLGFPIGVTVALNRWILFGPTIVGRHVLEYKSDLGHISLLLLMLFFASLIIDSILQAALPALSRAKRKAAEGSYPFLNFALCYSIPLCCVLMLAVMTYGYEFTVFVFGEEYKNAGTLFWIAMLLLLPYTWQLSLVQLFTLKHKTKLLCYWTCLGAIWMTGSLSLFEQQFGVTGILYAVGLGLIITVSGLFLHALKHGDICTKGIRQNVLLCGCACIVYFAAFEQIGGNLSFALSCLCFLPYIYVFISKSGKREEI